MSTLGHHVLFEQISPDTENKNERQFQTSTLPNNLFAELYHDNRNVDNSLVLSPSVDARPPTPESNEEYYKSVTQPFYDSAVSLIKQEKASFWNKVAIQIKLFFYTGFFAFFSQIQWKTFTATTVVHYVMLPLAPLFESIEVISNIYQIAVSHKTDLKLWISLAVNLVKFVGVGLAVGLLLAGMIATSALLATIGSAAFVGALGLKTLFHVGMSLYHLVKSFNSNPSHFKKSEHRHEALTHFTGGMICAALTVCSAFVMLKGFMLMAIVGAGVSFAGAIVGIGLMYKNYKRKQNEKDKIAANLDENNLFPEKIPAHYNYDYSNKYPLSEPSQSRNCCRWRNPFKGLMSGLMGKFSSTSPADVTSQKKKNDDYDNIRRPIAINANILSAANSGANNNGLVNRHKPG